MPASEQSLGPVFEFAAIGMALLAPDFGRLLAANRALCEMLGYTQDELRDLPPQSLSQGNDWQEDVVQRSRLLAGESTTYQAERRLLHRNGRIVWGLVTCALERDDQGRALHFIIQIQDISRAKAAEAQVREQSHLLDQAHDAIVVHNLDGTIRYWNQGAQRMFGFKCEQAVGKTLESLMGSGAALAAPAIADLIAAGQWSGELDCVDAAGRLIVVERHCTLMRSAEGEVSGIMAIDSDVTEHRRAEKEIVLLNNVLEQRIRKRTTELEESNEDLRDFAYSLAHDLRAPLASIDGFSAQLEARLAAQLDEKARHYLRRVRTGVKLMADLTDALLALADLSNTQLLHQDVDLSSIARGIAERLREQEPHRQVTVVVEDTPRAQGDIRLLADVMENLLGNAWKFTAKTQRAQITFGGQSWPNGSYLYHVKDNGAGFDPAYAYKLFAPFQRLHSNSEFEGTGIGLAMVRKIVSRHAGRVWAESQPGEGASFFFTLNESALQRPALQIPAKAAAG